MEVVHEAKGITLSTWLQSGKEVGEEIMGVSISILTLHLPGNC